MVGRHIRDVALAALVVLLPTAARADDVDAFHRGRADLGFGLLAGGFSIGPIDGPGVGVHFDVGWNRRQLYLYGEYDLLSVGQAQEVEKPIRGLLHRVSGNARFAFADFGGGDVPLEGEFWVEGGLGRELIVWNEGGELHRSDGSLGFGVEMNVATKRDRPRPQIIGIYYAFKLTVARAPGPEERMAACGGPCDEATRPSPYDLGLFFNGGFSWGR